MIFMQFVENKKYFMGLAAFHIGGYPQPSSQPGNNHPIHF